MIREFSVLVHLMEKGFQPKNCGSGWFIEQPNPITGETDLVEVDRFAIMAAKRFGWIDLVEVEACHAAVLKSQSTEEDENLATDLSADLTPLSNPERLLALEHSGLLDSPPEECFDRLTKLASEVLHAAISLITVVSADRQYIKSQFGLPQEYAEQRCTSLADSCCKYVVANGRELVISDGHRHPLAHDIPIFQKLEVRSYAGFPVKSPEGLTLGAFCVMDHKPRHWSERDLALLADFSDMAALYIEANELRHQLHQDVRKFMI